MKESQKHPNWSDECENDYCFTEKLEDLDVFDNLKCGYLFWLLEPLLSVTLKLSGHRTEHRLVHTGAPRCGAGAVRVETLLRSNFFGPGLMEREPVFTVFYKNINLTFEKHGFHKSRNYNLCRCQLELA